MLHHVKSRSCSLIYMHAPFPSSLPFPSSPPYPSALYCLTFIIPTPSFDPTLTTIRIPISKSPISETHSCLRRSLPGIYCLFVILLLYSCSDVGGCYDWLSIYTYDLDNLAGILRILRSSLTIYDLRSTIYNLRIYKSQVLYTLSPTLSHAHLSETSSRIGRITPSISARHPGPTLRIPNTGYIQDIHLPARYHFTRDINPQIRLFLNTIRKVK